MFNKNYFSKRLNTLRKLNNLTLQQLGSELGSTKATISNLENENKSPSVDMLISLADFFNVSLDYLVGRSDDNTFVPSQDYQSSCSDEERIQDEKK